nr:hypothetical protein [Haliscomenobacter sp.]
MGDRSGQFCEAENKGEVEDRDNDCGNQKSDRACCTPAVVPAEVFAGNDQADGNSPEMDGGEGAFEGCVGHVRDVFG